jgi:hypothetical protein
MVYESLDGCMKMEHATTQETSRSVHSVHTKEADMVPDLVGRIAVS